MDGLGLVYNAGEQVEGYTNFLWTIFLGFGGCFGGTLARVVDWVGFGVLFDGVDWPRLEARPNRIGLGCLVGWGVDCPFSDLCHLRS